MALRRISYNPAFLSEQDLVDSFVVRERDLELVIETIRENTAASNQHLLIVGPRGMGKTTLVLRAAAAVRADETLDQHWFPLVFSEESYEVSSPGQFWSEALFHLGKQVPNGPWTGIYRELQSERDENRLHDRALAHLMDFADQQRKRVLVIVENLNMILAEQVSQDDAWRLRHTLQNEPRIMLLATATSRFDEIERSDRAMYELFRVHELDPLDRDACRRLWAARTGVELAGDRIRPMEILTGGNPRLLAILSSFAAGRSLRSLMDELAQLIDEHTAYFKTNLEVLPPAERRIFVTLADLWEPATARQVAEAARVDVSQASSMLHRLVGRGAVSTLPGDKRTKTYQVAERLYNVYHLMRRSVGHDTPVQLLVDFMYAIYEPDELVQLTLEIAAEACSVGDERRDHFRAYQAILEAAQSQMRRRILESTDPAFFGLPDLPAALRRQFEESRRPKRRPKAPLAKLREATRRRPKDTEAWLALGHHLSKSDGPGAIKAYKQALKLDPWSVEATDALTSELVREGNFAEAVDIIERLIARGPHVVDGWVLLGLTHFQQEEWAKAEPALRQAVSLDKNNQHPFAKVAWAHSLQRMHQYKEAEDVLLRETARNPQYVNAWLDLGMLYENRERYEEAAAAYRKIIALDPSHAVAWMRFGIALMLYLKDPGAAEEALLKAKKLDPKLSLPHVYLGLLLASRRELDAAKSELRTALKRDPTCVEGAFGLALLLATHGQAEEAIEVMDRFLAIAKTTDEWITLCMEVLISVAPLQPTLEALAGRVIVRAPEQGRYPLAVAALRAAQKRWDDSLDAVRVALADTEAMPSQTTRLTRLITEAAAAGYAQQALAVVERSPSGKMFQPLIVALKIVTGKEPVAPAEVIEVARDVVARIEAAREPA